MTAVFLKIFFLSILKKSNSLKSLTGKNGKEKRLEYLFGFKFNLSKYLLYKFDFL